MDNYVRDLFNVEMSADACISFEVKAKVFKEVFEHLKLIFKSAVVSQTFSLEIKDSIATISATPSFTYKVTFPVENVNGGTSLTQQYVFSDICKLLPGRGTLNVIMASTVLKVADNRTMSVILKSSLASLLEVDFNELSYEPFNLKQLQSAIGRTKRLAPIFKAYKKTPPMLFKGGLMQMLLPDVYIQSQGAGLDVVLDSTTADILGNIFPEDINDGELAIKGNEAYFKSYNTCFSCTCSRDIELVDMDSLLTAYTYITTINYSELYARVKSLQQAVGEGDVLVEIFDDHVSVSRLEGNNRITCIVGNVALESKLLLNFTYKLELITPIISFLGDTIDIYKGGNTICWKKGTSMILTSCRA